MNLQFSLSWQALPLRYPWKLSRNTSVSKTNGFVRLEWNDVVGLGEIAPNIRYHETPELVEQAFQKFLEEVPDSEDWELFLKEADLPACLRCGLDMAYQDARCSMMGPDGSPFEGLPDPSPRPIGYTIPVMTANELTDFFQTEKLDRFHWLKLKVNRELAQESLEQLLRLYKGPVAIDGNEAWTDCDEVLAFSRLWPKERILFLEQPLPASLRDSYRYLKNETALPIWGDESVLNEAEPGYWKEAFSGVNVKLMKAGSLATARHLLESARNSGLQTMVGCMVETSLGISNALRFESLADYLDLDGFMVLQTDPFGKVVEENGILSLTTA